MGIWPRSEHLRKPQPCRAPLVTSQLRTVHGFSAKQGIRSGSDARTDPRTDPRAPPRTDGASTLPPAASSASPAFHAHANLPLAARLPKPPPCRPLNGSSETAVCTRSCAGGGGGPDRNPERNRDRNRDRNPERTLHLGRLLPRPYPCSAPSGSREQCREQLAGFGFLCSRQRLKPWRLEPQLIVIDRPAQRDKLAAAVRRVSIGHSAVGACGGACGRGSSLSTLTVG